MPELESELAESLEQLRKLVNRRRWWILGIAFVTTLAIIGVILLIPNRYSSEATLVVVQQRVSQAYVPATSTTTIADAVQTMTREILSHTRLIAIIDEFGLYAKEKNNSTPDGVIARMRKDVNIEPLDPTPAGNFSAFKISFTADSPNVAQMVTKRLTSLFIDENIKTREEEATTTTRFLTQKLEAAKQKLTQQEQRLREFKMSNLGELPEQQATNMGLLMDLRMQLTNTTASLSRARQQRAFLESLISGNVSRLESERSILLTRFTARHPDVIKKDREIKSMQALLTRVKTGTGGIEDQDNSAAPDDPSLAQLKSQLDANSAEIASLSKDQQARSKEIAQYQKRVSFTPLREQELSAILREYELFKRDYTDLMSKQLQSQLTASLEERREGQHFRLVDPPTTPVAPISPKRVKISLGGAAAGILLGFVAAFLVDSKDRSFHTEQEVIRALKLPLVGVPLLLTSAEERIRNRTRILEWLAGSAMIVTLLAVEYYIYTQA